MIFRRAGTHFLSTVAEPGAVYVRWRCQWQPYNCAYCMIFVSLGPSFRQRFLSKQQSMYIEDFIVSRRSGLIGWFLCAWVLVFGNGFWASNSLCTLNISSSVLELVFEDDFQNSRDSVFVNCFWASNSLCTLKISSSCVELVFEDDFQKSRDSFFVNCCWARSSLCALKMSVAAIELCLLHDFCVPRS